MTRTITALFDTVDAAERAAHTLAERVSGVRGTIYDSRTSADVGRISIPGEDRRFCKRTFAAAARCSMRKFQTINSRQ